MVQTKMACIDLNENSISPPKKDKSTIISSISREIGCLKGKYLWQEKDINEAKAVLYKVYIEEMRWKFAEDNPTGFSITNENGMDLLTDNLDNSIHWFGVYHGSKLVACIRLIEINDKGHLDLTLYKDYQNEDLKSKLNHYICNGTMELQRSATLKEYRKLGAMSIAASMAVEFAALKQMNLVMTSPCNILASFMKECQMEVLGDCFDYGDGVLTYLLYGYSNTLMELSSKIMSVAEGLVNKHQEFIISS